MRSETHACCLHGTGNMRCARLSRDSNDTLVTCTVLARFSAARSLAHISIRAELFMIQPSRQYPIKIINTEYAVKNTVKLLNLNSLNGWNRIIHGSIGSDHQTQTLCPCVSCKVQYLRRSRSRSSTSRFQFHACRKITLALARRPRHGPCTVDRSRTRPLGRVGAGGRGRGSGRADPGERGREP